MSVEGRREKSVEWVHRGRYAVQVEVEVVYPVDDPTTPCLEPDTLKHLDEIAHRAQAGDIMYLRSVGKVFEEVAAQSL